MLTAKFSPMKSNLLILFGLCLFCSLSVFSQRKNTIIKEKIPDEIRSKQISDMQFGMFICWSFMCVVIIAGNVPSLHAGWD